MQRFLTDEKKEKSDVPFDITNDECSSAEVFSCNTGRYVTIKRITDGAVCPMQDVYGNKTADYEGLFKRARRQARKICKTKSCCNECQSVTIYFFNLLSWWQRASGRGDFEEVIPCGE